jgi:hypothetical protein
MDLFEYRDGRAFPSIHALIIEPFKSLWEKDTTEDHGECVKVFTYIELLCSPKISNPYYTVHESVRPAKLKRDIWGDENYESQLYGTLELISAIRKYKELLLDSAPGYSTLLSAISAANTLEDYLNQLNLNERTKGGVMVIKPADVTKALKDIPDVVKSLKRAREEVHNDLKESSKTRNEREIGPFER